MSLFRKKASSSGGGRSRETVILFSLGALTFAVAAEAVDEIRNLDGLLEYKDLGHHRLTKVNYTLDRQQRTYFVIDAAAQFRMQAGKPTRVLLMRHIPVGVLVDGIDHMQEISWIDALPLAFAGEERNWYRGLAIIKGKVVPVVRPECFLSKAEASVLTATLSQTLFKQVAVAL
jgi:chemotaxis signal transduction protein